MNKPLIFSESIILSDLGNSSYGYHAFACRAMLLHIGAFRQVDRADIPGGYHVAIKEAFESFTRWRRLHKIQSSQRRFHYKGIFNDVYGCYLNSKGFNARILCEWLLHEIIRVRSQPGVFLHDERLQWTENALRLDSMKVHMFVCQVFG